MSILATQKSENYLHCTRETTFGIVQNSAENYYGHNKDFYIFNSFSSPTSAPCARFIPREKWILAYYVWDYTYSAIDTPEKYRAYLRRRYDYGVRYTCYLDFSVWYSESREKNLAQIQKAFDYAEIAIEEGYKLVWNNNLCNRYFDVIEKQLPETLDVYVVDGNHKEDKLELANMTEREIYAKMKERFKPKKILFITGNRRSLFHRDYLVHDPGFCMLPSERALQTIKMRLYYGE